MGSVSSEEAFDPQSQRFGSYSLSADVSESESCCSFSCRQYDPDATSSSLPSTPFTAGGFGITPHVSSAFPAVGGTDMVVLAEKAVLSEVEMMKERFAKLLLGEDMSGGGKGVCTALAISNAITNLSATVFGELWRLEPLAPTKKSMWHREMESILCVSDCIVELVPSLQDFPGGGVFEVMVTRPRSDLYTNLPALKKLNSMLIGMLDEFVDIEFWYVDRGILVADAEKINGYPSSSSVGIGSGSSLRQEEKWWLPCPRVPPNGLSDEARKRLLQCKDYANQILKAAMAINSSVLSEMEIPDIYYRILPKTGKSCLGDVIYSYIIADKCSPESVLDCLDLSSEHDALELANRVEAAIHVWSQKHRKTHQHSPMQKPSWGSKVKGLIGDLKKSLLLAHRSESLLHSLRLRCPGLPQTDLDMNKIQHNKDVGQSIIESYSRVTESLAFNIIARIDDVIYVDDAARQYAAAELVSPMGHGLFGGPIQKKISPSSFSINSPLASPFFVPKFSSPPPVIRSPRKTRNALSKGICLGLRDGNVDMLISADREKGWSYTGNVSARRDSGVAPERD